MPLNMYICSQRSLGNSILKSRACQDCMSTHACALKVTGTMMQFSIRYEAFLDAFAKTLSYFVTLPSCSDLLSHTYHIIFSQCKMWVQRRLYQNAKKKSCAINRFRDPESIELCVAIDEVIWVWPAMCTPSRASLVVD